MLNMGPLELLVIAAVALLIVGPKRLPELGKTIGRSLRDFRKAQDDFTSSFKLDDDDAPPSFTGSAGRTADRVDIPRGPMAEATPDLGSVPDPDAPAEPD